MTKYFAALLMFIAAWPSFAADPNGYTARYECRAGGPNCNVDVATYVAHACDQTITSADSAATISSKINGGSQYICITNGDYTGKGTITVTASGTSQAYKVLRYYRSGDNNDEPWNQSAANQAKISQLKVQGSYWIIHRLTFPGISGNTPSPRIQSGAGKTNQIFNRVLIEGTGSGSNYYGYSQDNNFSGYNNLTFQNSVVRNIGPYQPIYEIIGVDIGTGANIHVVNNQIYDIVSHPIQMGNDHRPTMLGVVVENNDLYVSPALYTNGGAKAKSESPLSVKAAGTSATPIKIIHNRIWGSRMTDLTYCCNGEGGNAVTWYTDLNNILFQNNIVFDSQIGVNNLASHDSFIGNLFFKIHQFYSGSGARVWNRWDDNHGSPSNTEFYLNTIIDASQYSFPTLADPYQDVKCNVLISSGTKYPGTTPSTSIADHNVFYDTTSFTFNGTSTNVNRSVSTRSNSTHYNVGDILRTAAISSCVNGTESACFLYKVTMGGTSAGSTQNYCTTLGCTQTDGTIELQAIRGPYIFKRKLKTVNGGESYVVPYARVHAAASEFSACPSSYGNRTGIGIGDAL